MELGGFDWKSIFYYLVTSDQSLQQNLEFEVIRCTFWLSAAYHLKKLKVQIVDNHVLSTCDVICGLC
jgi:hypothetical protein